MTLDAEVLREALGGVQAGLAATDEGSTGLPGGRKRKLNGWLWKAQTTSVIFGLSLLSWKMMRNIQDFELSCVSGGLVDSPGIDPWGSMLLAADSGGGLSSSDRALIYGNYGYTGDAWAGYTPPAVSGACIAGAIALLGAVGSAVKSPNPWDVAKAVGGVGAWWDNCAQQFGGSYLAAGGYGGWVQP